MECRHKPQHLNKMQKKKALCTILILVSVNTLFSQFGDSIAILDSMRLYEFFNGDTVTNMFSIYESDNHGNTDLGHTLSYNQYNPEGQKSRQHISYDPYGYQSFREWELWDEGISDWVLSNKWTYTHDHLGRERSKAFYTWDKNYEMLIGRVKDSTGYDFYGNIDYEQDFEWNYSYKDWTGTQWEKTLWNEKGHLIQTIISSGSSTKSEYLFTADGLDSLQMTYIWDNTNTVWALTDSSRSVYTFDGFGRTEEVLRYSWSE